MYRVPGRSINLSRHRRHVPSLALILLSSILTTTTLSLSLSIFFLCINASFLVSLFPHAMPSAPLDRIQGATVLPSTSPLNSTCHCGVSSHDQPQAKQLVG